MAHAYCLRTTSFSLLPLAILSLAVLGTSGCNLNQGSNASPLSTSTALSLQGRVFGGQQPVVGATIQLYAAGTPSSGGGYGVGATPLITGTLPTTNASGSFTFTYNLPASPSYFYITATGGSPGNVDPSHPNTNIVLMAAVGGCTASTTLPVSFININEVTTAAAALALQPYIATPTGTAGAAVLIGAPATNFNDLRTAFQTASNLVNASTGVVVNPTGSKGKLINTMADILASCVNSDPNSDPQPCSNLFTDAASPSTGDTVQAAWYIAQNPANNVSALFGLVPSSPPFVALSSAPASFAVTSPTDLVGCFAVLGYSAVANTGSTVVSGGDVGSSPTPSITGFGTGAGTVTPPATIDNADAANAQIDLTAAYDYAVGLSPVTENLTGKDLGNLGASLTPGVYFFSAAAALTGTLTLDAQNNPDAVFIFQIGSTLTTASSSQVVLINGAQPQNVFWQVGSSATLGASSTFEGTIMAYASITAYTGASVDGRVLASTGAVTLDDNAVTAP